MDNIQFLEAGTSLWQGTYVVKKVLGHGGFGITYLAYDTSLDKNVALKEFFPGAFCSRDSDSGGVVTTSAAASEEFIARFKDKFLKEARRMAKLNHPNLVRVQTAFEENSTAYYVMDYIDGGNLQDLVKKNGPLSFNVAMKYIRQVGNALDYLHSQRMNHLDVKPANIMLRSDDTVALIDFGLSKQYDTKGNQTSTTPVGISHGYAPIEQYSQDGIKDFSASTDVYSLAATLYYLLSGTVPPASTELLDSELSFPASIPQNIRPALQKAMNPRRKERFQSAKDFINALTNPAAADDGATQILTHNNSADATQIISTPHIISTPEKPLGTKEEKEKKKSAFSLNSKTGLLIGAGVIIIGAIIWAVVTFKGKPANSEFSTPDLTLFEVKGPVSSITYSYEGLPPQGDSNNHPLKEILQAMYACSKKFGGVLGDQFEFSLDGKLLLHSDGNEYNDSSEIIKIDYIETFDTDLSPDKETESDFPAYMEITWQNGLPVKLWARNNGGLDAALTINLQYNDPNSILPESIEGEFIVGVGAMDVKGRAKITYDEFDKYGNWTKKTLVGRGTYSSWDGVHDAKSFTVTVTRTITYYE